MKVITYTLNNISILVGLKVNLIDYGFIPTVVPEGVSGTPARVIVVYKKWSKQKTIDEGFKE